MKVFFDVTTIREARARNMKLSEIKQRTSYVRLSALKQKKNSEDA